jgi:hypothetical protein
MVGVILLSIFIMKDEKLRHEEAKLYAAEENENI